MTTQAPFSYKLQSLIDGVTYDERVYLAAIQHLKQLLLLLELELKALDASDTSPLTPSITKLCRQTELCPDDLSQDDLIRILNQIIWEGIVAVKCLMIGRSNSQVTFIASHAVIILCLCEKAGLLNHDDLTSSPP